MARITSYSTLATAVQDYLQRSDVGVSSGNLDYLLGEVEEELNARLRVAKMLTSVTPTVSSLGVVTHPTDFGGWKRFVARQGSVEWNLELMDTEEQARLSSLFNTDGVPKALLLSISGFSKIFPWTDGVYTFTAIYYARIPQLTSGAATNWVITNYPSVYLYGCLAAAAGYALDDEPTGGSRETKWLSRFQAAVKRIQREDRLLVDARSNVALPPDSAMFSRLIKNDIVSDGQ